MVVVSEIMLYFKLENIRSDSDLMRIINTIRYSLSSIKDPSNKILVLKIQEIDCDDSTMVPKLEHKNL